MSPITVNMKLVTTHRNDKQRATVALSYLVVVQIWSTRWATGSGDGIGLLFQSTVTVIQLLGNFLRWQEHWWDRYMYQNITLTVTYLGSPNNPFVATALPFTRLPWRRFAVVLCISLFIQTGHSSSDNPPCPVCFQWGVDKQQRSSSHVPSPRTTKSSAMSLPNCQTIHHGNAPLHLLDVLTFLCVPQPVPLHVQLLCIVSQLTDHDNNARFWVILQ